MCYFLFLLFQFMLIFIISGLVILGYCSKVCVSSEPVFFRIFFISISYRSTCFSFDMFISLLIQTTVLSHGHVSFSNGEITGAALCNNSVLWLYS